MKPLPVLLAMGLFVLAATPSCRSAGAEERSPAAGDRLAALVGDSEVEGRLETLGARTTSEGARNVLRMELRNKSDSTLVFDWAVEWFDRSGSLLAGRSRVWRSMKLAAGAKRPIEVPVPSPDAISWRLRAIRPG